MLELFRDAMIDCYEEELRDINPYDEAGELDEGYFKEEATEIIDKIVLGAVILLMCLVTFLCFKHKRPIVSLLSIIPTIMMKWAGESVPITCSGSGL